jgi:hypothetical protein
LLVSPSAQRNTIRARCTNPCRRGAATKPPSIPRAPPPSGNRARQR